MFKKQPPFVIPAKAGIQRAYADTVDPRFRENDEIFIFRNFDFY